LKFNLEDDNVLLLSKWKMKVSDHPGELDKFYHKKFEDEDWLDVTIGAWEMQLPQEREKEDYPVTLMYRTSFEIGKLPGSTSLIIDGFSGIGHKLYINGTYVTDKGKRSKLDAEMKEIDIRQFLNEGKNHIAVELTANRRTDGILDLLKIMGDFSLQQTKNGYKIIEKIRELKIGTWTTQGYPFYSGTGIYETEIDIPKKYLDGKLFLKAECGEDVLEVVINGKDEIIIPWHPYKADITNYIKEGRNKITLKITNTLINVLEAVQKESGLFKEPVIEHAHKYKFLF
jgi:hypothetical protein